jgi:hypothetical protein
MFNKGIFLKSIFTVLPFSLVNVLEKMLDFNKINMFNKKGFY